MNYYSFDQSINEKVQKSAVQTSSGVSSEGEIPALNAAGQIDSSMLPSGLSLIVVGNTQPSVVDGSVLWNRTTAGKQGLYRFDTTRNRWIDLSTTTLVYGEDRANNNNLGGPGMTEAGNFSGYNVPYEFTVLGITMACRDFSGNTPSKVITLRERTEDDTPSDIQNFTITRSGVATDDPGYMQDMNLNIQRPEEPSGQRQIYFFAQSAGGSALDIFVKMIIARSVNVP